MGDGGEEKRRSGAMEGCGRIGDGESVVSITIAAVNKFAATFESSTAGERGGSEFVGGESWGCRTSDFRRG